MKYAIIAAGEGSRLQQEGAGLPKPMVRLGGVPMLERLVRLFVQQGAHEVAVIVNRRQPHTLQHLRTLQRTLPLQVVVKDTPGSMHSFYELSHLLGGDRFILTTVDTVFSPVEFARYRRAFEQSPADGLFAVTSFVDDEKPLYVSVDDEMRIDGFLDADPLGSCRYVSGGIYGLTPPALPLLARAVEQGMTRMRSFQRLLVESGLHLQAFPFEKIIDVDHVADIAKAQALIADEPAPAALAQPPVVWALRRAPRFSPNCVEGDAAILQAVQQNLSSLGLAVRLLGEEEFCALPRPSAADAPPAAIVGMARSDGALLRLQEWAKEGVPVVNSPAGVMNARRLRLAELLAEGGIPQPQTWQLSTHPHAPLPPVEYPCWLKRGDGHSLLPDDVSYLPHEAALRTRLAAFAARGIDRALLCRHLAGDLVKFYGVQGGFFHWLYPAERGQSKFGLERHNSPLSKFPFDSAALQRLAQRAAQLTGLAVYGGDAIVSPRGEISIIDFNDWPSFSACRQQAARAIAQYVASQIK